MAGVSARQMAATVAVTTVAITNGGPMRLIKSPGLTSISEATSNTKIASTLIRLLRRDRDHAKRAAAAVDDLERRRDHHGTGRRKCIEITETRQPELPCPMQLSPSTQ